MRRILMFTMACMLPLSNCKSVGSTGATVFSIMASFLTVCVAFFVGLYLTRKSQIDFYNNHKPQYRFKVGSNVWVMNLLFSLLWFSAAIILTVVDRSDKNMKIWICVLVLLVLGGLFLYRACFDMFHKLYFDYDMVTYKEFLKNPLCFSNKQIVSYKCFKAPWRGAKKRDNIYLTFVDETNNPHIISFYLPFKKRILFYEWCLQYCCHALDETPTEWGDFL